MWDITQHVHVREVPILLGDLRRVLVTSDTDVVVIDFAAKEECGLGIANKSCFYASLFVLRRKERKSIAFFFSILTPARTTDCRISVVNTFSEHVRLYGANSIDGYIFVLPSGFPNRHSPQLDLFRFKLFTPWFKWDSGCFL
jgi:hypothetical protein